MLLNYNRFGIEITCKDLPKGCVECPFEEWLDPEGLEYACVIVDGLQGHKTDGSQEHRLKNCPLRKREE